jgi:ribosomal protein S18 acetylase RimI-like enzyme
VGPWRGDRRVALVVPVADGPPPSAQAVRHCLDVLAARGFAEVVTAALSPREQAGFQSAGFELHERLHLLALDLTRGPGARPNPISWFRRVDGSRRGSVVRRARRRDRGRLLVVDNAAFPPFWQLDEGGLVEALRATPSSRLRVAVDPEVVGYAISGRAGQRGYLQRLAVDPEHQGNGIGRALAIDGLRWMARRGVEQAVVNTQYGNEAALAVYDQLGFRVQPGGLAVMTTRIPAAQ